MPLEKSPYFTSFAGTYHCETVMFSLQLLARAWLNMTTTSVAERGVLLPDKEIVKDITILPVTKRCCPARHIFLNYVSDLTLKAIRYLPWQSSELVELLAASLDYQGCRRAHA